MLYIAFIILVLSVLLYILFNNYQFNIYLKRNSHKSLILQIKKKLGGKFISEAYFSQDTKIISKKQYFPLNHSQKAKFTLCYDILEFETKTLFGEIFFNLEKNEQNQFEEYLNLKIFPKHLTINSQGTVEKVFDEINIFTNNRYLAQVLESHQVQQLLKEVIIHKDDSISVNQNNLNLKISISNKKTSLKEISQKLNLATKISKHIFKTGVLEY